MHTLATTPATLAAARPRGVIRKVARYQLRDVARSRWLAAYTLFFATASWALLQFGGAGDRALLSLLNVVLFVVPLVTIVFGTIYLYNAREFIELLLAQPVRRAQLFTGLYLGLVVPLSLAVVVGIAMPFLLTRGAAVAARGNLVALSFVGVALTFVFTGFAALIATRNDDRLRGLGVAISVWLLSALVYDGLVLLAVALFADYPLERPMLALMLANPVDLARIIMILRFDV
ncbi:MAG: ABC transporter permease, partial [Gemmatimonadota bacterium]|nr:ABC transporter permease [Gemmatimonadota bacterium]